MKIQPKYSGFTRTIIIDGVFIETNLTPITPVKKNVYGFDGEFIYSVIEKLKG